MAKKTGVCANIDCDHYKESFEIEAGGEFECPYCHQPLREATGKHKGPGGGNGGNGNGKKIAIIVAIVAVLALVAIVVVRSCGNPSKPITEDPGGDGGPEKPDTLRPDTLTLPPVNPPGENPGEDDGEGPGQENPPVTDGRGTVDLGYGVYTGELKNGKPHGWGTITYKQEHQIVPSKDFVAKPGDQFEGEFRNGRISGQGYWKHDGNETGIKP